MSCLLKFPAAQSSHTPRISSASCSFAVFVSLFPWQLAPADAVALWTCLAAIDKCAQSGVLRSRGGALERAAARVCREAGARVTTHTLLSDLNVPAAFGQQTHRSHSKWTALASRSPIGSGHHIGLPLTSTGHPRQRRGDFTGAALADARRAKERTYPELPWKWGPMERGGGDLHQVLGPSPQPWSTCTLEASNSPGIHCSLVGPAHPCGSNSLRPQSPFRGPRFDRCSGWGSPPPQRLAGLDFHAPLGFPPAALACELGMRSCTSGDWPV